MRTMNTTSSAAELVDLTIIGGGPVGLYAAYYAGLRQMKTQIIDSLDQLGGQLATLYPEKYIYDVAGFPKVIARDLVNSLVEQGMQHGCKVHLNETVQTLTRDEARNCFILKSDKGEHLTRTVIICAGAGAFQPRKVGVAATVPHEGKGVYYAVGSKSVFAGKKLLIIGGGDSALDWAMNLKDTAAEITVIHRRNQFRAHEDSVARVLASGTRILTFCELKDVQTSDNKICGVLIHNSQKKEDFSLAVDAILVQVGFISSLGAIKNWPIKIEGNSIMVDTHMQTNLPGVFAAGDVAGFDGKLKLISTGFGEAATAVNFAKTFIDPHARAFPGHSSEMGPQALTTINTEKDATVLSHAG